MGRDGGRNSNGRRDNIKTTHHERPLTQRPFTKELKDFKPWGPTCLRCGDTIDTRLGASMPTGMRGSKRSQRQGYVHDRCLEKVEGQPNVVHAQLLSSLNEGSVMIGYSEGKKQYVDMVQGRGVCMEFPVYTEEEMLDAIEAGEALPA